MPRTPAATLLATAALLLAAAASQAAPTIRLSVRTEPIPEFAHTGNIAGAGASILTQVGIDGSEYGGHPPPLVGISLRLPPGMRWNESGFPACLVYALEPGSPGPFGCPQGSEVHPESKAALDVAFGTEVVNEEATISTRYALDGGLTLKLFGHEPVLIEILTRGIARQDGSGKGELLLFEVPLVETVPGGVDASFTSIGYRLGSGFQPDPKTQRFSLHVPRHCPRGFLRFSVEARFAALGGLPPQTATASDRTPCPHKAQRSR